MHKIKMAYEFLRLAGTSRRLQSSIAVMHTTYITTLLEGPAVSKADNQIGRMPNHATAMRLWGEESNALKFNHPRQQ